MHRLIHSFAFQKLLKIFIAGINLLLIKVKSHKFVYILLFLTITSFNFRGHSVSKLICLWVCILIWIIYNNGNKSSLIDPSRWALYLLIAFLQCHIFNQDSKASFHCWNVKRQSCLIYMSVSRKSWNTVWLSEKQDSFVAWRLRAVSCSWLSRYGLSF